MAPGFGKEKPGSNARRVSDSRARRCKNATGGAHLRVRTDWTNNSTVFAALSLAVAKVRMMIGEGTFDV
jgi:hypothetical protein